MAATFAAALDRIGQVQARLPAAVAILVGIAALAAVAVPDLWRVTRHISVLAHEGAHATIGSATGRRVNSVVFTPKSGGRTSLSGARGPGYVAAGLAGYLGPSAFGLAAAGLIATGHVVAVLWLGLLALLALMVPLAKSFRNFGLVSVLGTFGALFLIARYGTVEVQVLAGYGMAWFLLLSGVRVVREDGTSASDAAMLRDLTKLPRSLWSGLWLAGSLAALGFGATLLI